jgi:GNAT superfamily N-acetyltransferase
VTQLLASWNLSAELGERYGDDGSGAFRPDDVRVPGEAFVIARLDGRAVRCGALRPLERGVGEVKRMFVSKESRRQGIARKILEQLETIACVLGYGTLCRETGARQPGRSDCTSRPATGAFTATAATSIAR